MQKKISKSTKHRLLLLLQLLENWKKNHITSKEIARLLGIKDSLVRYDFSVLNIPNGHRGFKNGYEVLTLKSDIKNSLKIAFEIPSNENHCNINRRKVCVVGLGRLGIAFLDNSICEKTDFEICAGFDSSLNRVELIRSTFELFPASKIETVCKEKKIEYALLCCSENEVQKMVERLVNAGLKGIVNYTNAVFEVPCGIKVQNVSPAVVLGMVE